MSAGDGFFKRGKIWWFRTDPITGKQASSGKRDRRSAEIEYTTRSRLASDPSYQPETEASVSLNHWAVKFVEHKRATKAADTAKFYADKLGHVVRLFGAHTAISVALRPQAFDQYALTRKAEGARATTIRKEIGAARTLARFAARHGAYHGRPELFMPGDLSDDYEPGERWLTPWELLWLLPDLPGKRVADVCLRIAFGSRYAEAYRVQPEDVDTDAWLVYVRGTKTKRARATIPIAPPFRQLLLLALPHLPLERWHNSNMVRDLGKACARAGVPRMTANDLRRTHGSWLAQAGVGDEHIGKVLRHADGRMARRVYGQLPPAQLGALVGAKFTLETSHEPRHGSDSEVRDGRGREGGGFHGPANGQTGSAADHDESPRAPEVAGRAACKRDCGTPKEAAKALTGATIVQQLPARVESSATETQADSLDSAEEDMWIENPRVGGSIPSRDTKETACFSGDVKRFTCRDVAPNDAIVRSVRNDSATAGQSLWWLGQVAL